MKTHAGDKTAGTSSEFSVLDWPSPEALMAARRARGQALRDMTVELCRSLRGLALRSLTPFRSSREHPARPDADSLPRATRETLARAWLEN
jgi:hypothetical protein